MKLNWIESQDSSTIISNSWSLTIVCRLFDVWQLQFLFQFQVRAAKLFPAPKQGHSKSAQLGTNFQPKTKRALLAILCLCYHFSPIKNETGLHELLRVGACVSLVMQTSIRETLTRAFPQLVQWK